MQRVFRCRKCQRGMQMVGSTGLSKQVERTAVCPYCRSKNKVMWPRGDPFRIQRIAIGCSASRKRHAPRQRSIIPTSFPFSISATTAMRPMSFPNCWRERRYETA